MTRITPNNQQVTTEVRFTLRGLHDLLTKIVCMVWEDEGNDGLPIKVEPPTNAWHERNDTGEVEKATITEGIEQLEKLLAEFNQTLQKIDHTYHEFFGCGEGLE